MKNINREVPKLYDTTDLCSGCSACYSICSMKAINMIEDAEGFLYPNIDENKCVRCYRCVNVCPIEKDRNLASDRAKPSR